MPAIQPTRLRFEVVSLVEQFDRPMEFLTSLHILLDFYADRTLRSSQVVDSAPLLNSYRVPKPVMRAIERELAPLVDADPEAALALADELWDRRWLETRLLAVSILGRVSADYPDSISERAKKWGAKCKEDRVIKALAEDGIKRLRENQFDQYIQLLDDWYSSDNLSQITLGLRSTPSLLKSNDFDNLPLIFRWMGPLVRETDLELMDDLSDVLRSLAASSPNETAYFIKQILASSSNDQAAKMLRRIVDEFPEEKQQQLIDEIRVFRSNISNGS